MKEWSYIGTNFEKDPNIVMAVREGEDDHEDTIDVVLDCCREEITIRRATGDRELHAVAAASAPLEVIVEILKLAGYKIEAPDPIA